jgi:hypothetical protein
MLFTTLDLYRGFEKHGCTWLSTLSGRKFWTAFRIDWVLSASAAAVDVCMLLGKILKWKSNHFPIASTHFPHSYLYQARKMIRYVALLAVGELTARLLCADWEKAKKSLHNGTDLDTSRYKHLQTSLKKSGLKYNRDTRLKTNQLSELIGFASISSRLRLLASAGKHRSSPRTSTSLPRFAR